MIFRFLFWKLLFGNCNRKISSTFVLVGIVYYTVLIGAVLSWKPRIIRLQLQFFSRSCVGTNCCNVIPVLSCIFCRIWCVIFFYLQRQSCMGCGWDCCTVMLMIHNSFGPDGGSQSRTDIHKTFSSVTREDLGVLLRFPQRSQCSLQKFCGDSGKHCASIGKRRKKGSLALGPAPPKSSTCCPEDA